MNPEHLKHDARRHSVQRRLALASGAFACAAFCCHFLMTLVYLSPPNLLRMQLDELATSYMNPLFYQNWHLFSPHPGITTTKLAVRCADRTGEWSEWADPTVSFYPEHYRYRFLGYGKLLRAYTYPATNLRDLVRDKRSACLEAASSDADPACDGQTIAAALPAGPELALATRYALRACAAGFPQAERAQFKLLEFYPLQYTERNSGVPWSHVDEYVFAEVAMNEPLTVSSR